MLDYFYILGHEIYKILFLLIPILVSVAMIVWFDQDVHRALTYVSHQSNNNA